MHKSYQTDSSREARAFLYRSGANLIRCDLQTVALHVGAILLTGGIRRGAISVPPSRRDSAFLDASFYRALYSANDKFVYIVVPVVPGFARTAAYLLILQSVPLQNSLTDDNANEHIIIAGTAQFI